MIDFFRLFCRSLRCLFAKLERNHVFDGPRPSCIICNIISHLAPAPRECIRLQQCFVRDGCAAKCEIMFETQACVPECGSQYVPKCGGHERWWLRVRRLRGGGVGGSQSEGARHKLSKKSVIGVVRHTDFFGSSQGRTIIIRSVPQSLVIWKSVLVERNQIVNIFT